MNLGCMCPQVRSQMSSGTGVPYERADGNRGPFTCHVIGLMSMEYHDSKSIESVSSVSIMMPFAFISPHLNAQSSIHQPCHASQLAPFTAPHALNPTPQSLSPACPQMGGHLPSTVNMFGPETTSHTASSEDRRPSTEKVNLVPF
jgi:hypothetical protein